MAYNKFQEEVQINKFRLDEAAEQNPELILKYGEMLAEARSIRDKAKEQLSYTKSTVELDYRENPPDGVKITEAVISALVTQESSVRDRIREYLEAQEAVYTLEAVMSALDDRRSEIKNLTQLWIGGYYATQETNQQDTAAMSLRNNLRSKSDLVED